MTCVLSKETLQFHHRIHKFCLAVLTQGNVWSWESLILLLKRFLKSFTVETARRRALSSVGLSRALLGLLGVGFDPPKDAKYRTELGRRASYPSTLTT